MTENTALISLSLTLLGTLLVSTWRFASLASTLTVTVTKLEKKSDALDAIPIMVRRLEQVEMLVAKHNSMIPRMTTDMKVLEGDLKVVQSKVVSLREMRAVQRSRPEFGGGHNDE